MKKATNKIRKRLTNAYYKSSIYYKSSTNYDLDEKERNMYGLGNAEMRVMKVLWEKGDLTAKEIAKELNGACGWNANTTYTLIKRCINKGAIERIEPNYLCHAKITRDEVAEEEMNSLLDRLFDGSFDKMFAAFAGKKTLSQETIERLKKIIED